MARSRPPDDDEDDDDFDDDELPEGVYYDDEPATKKCPYCREDVPEDAQYCSRCENYLSAEEAPRSSKPMWVWVLLILLLILFTLSAVGM